MPRLMQHMNRCAKREEPLVSCSSFARNTDHVATHWDEIEDQGSGSSSSLQPTPVM